MTKIITDNSKVNINLLEENELLKKQIKKLQLEKQELKKQLSIHGVVKSLPTKEENNIELEHKLQEYSNDYNFKNLKLDLGYKIGWKECYNSITK